MTDTSSQTSLQSASPVTGTDSSGPSKIEAVQPRAWFTRTVRTAAASSSVQVSVACWLVLFLTRQFLVFARHFESLHEHLGGENGNIALALASGRGFSDPFAALTGSTAWMPPSLPLLLAGLYCVFHTKSLVGQVFSCFSIALLAATGGIIFRIARDRAQTLPSYLVVLLYLGWIALYNFYFIVLTHDVAVITFLLALVVWHVHRAVQRQHMTQYWAVLGGVCLLTSPATALVWGCSSAAMAVRMRWNRVKLISVFAMSLAFCAPWLIRNTAVFHQFIPVKSNLYCDLYLANYVDDDGIWDLRSMRIHPYLSHEQRFIYERLGERAYIASYKRRFIRSLTTEPQRFARNVLRRTLAVTVQYVSSGTEADTRGERQCKRALQPLIFIAAVLTVLVKGSHQPLTRQLGLVWLAFMLPYVAIGLHVRHVLPVSPVLVLMAFLGTDALVAQRRKASRSPGYGGEGVCRRN